MRLIIAALLMTAVAASAQNVIIVTNTNNDGPGSLRFALEDADNDGQASLVTFDPSLVGDTILVFSDLTLNEDSTTISGDVNSDGVPDVALVSAFPGSLTGLLIKSAYNTVEGLSISSFSDGIQIRAVPNRIMRNVIKFNRNGVNVRSVTGTSILISENLIFGNLLQGIRNSDVPAPTLHVEDGLVFGSTEPGYVAEIFLDSGIPGAYSSPYNYQGEEFIGSVTADEDGGFEFSLDGLDLNAAQVTATVTDPVTIGTSNFSEGLHVQTVDGNRWGVDLANDGGWGLDSRSLNAGGEFPKGTNNYLLFAGGIYIGALKDATQADPAKRYSVSHHEFSGDFAPGLVGDPSAPSGQKSSFVSGTPVYVNGPAGGLLVGHWPFSKGAPASAPGVPGLISEMDSWTVFNDVDTVFHELDDTDVPVLGFEVRRMTYQFDESVMEGAEDIFFLHWRITNKTNLHYDSCFFAIWVDPDLWSPTNDLPGTDSLRNMFYIYNYEEESTPTGMQYAVGFKPVFSALGGGPHPSLFAATHFLSVANPADPYNDHQRYFYMKGLDQDGTIKLASEGLVENDGDRFVFPGDPLTGQGLLAQSRMPGGNDLRMMTSIAPFDLAPGQGQDVIFAVIGGEGNDRLDAIVRLRELALNLDLFFEDRILSKINTDTTASLLTLSVFQNPEVSLKNRVDFTLVSTEPLSHAKANVTMNQESSELPMDHIAGSDNVHLGNLILDETGLLSLTLDARDLAGNLATIDRTYTVFRTGGFGKDRTGESPTRPNLGSGTAILVSSPDGKLTLSLGPDEGPATFGLLGAEGLPVAADSRIRPWALGATYRVGPDGVATNATLTFRYDPDDRVTDPARLGIYRDVSGSWQHAGGELKDGSVSTEITEFGKYGLFYNEGNLVPAEFALDQNYPNPFNPVTTIRYQLPEDSKVTLTVYNVLGQKVRTLVDTKQNAGIYSARWDGKNDFGVNVASGVYVYRIEAGDFVKVRKMLMVR